MKTKIQYANKWFQLHNIPTIIYGGSIYIETGHFELELSEEEISYRAECYLDSEKQKINN